MRELRLAQARATAVIATFPVALPAAIRRSIPGVTDDQLRRISSEIAGRCDLAMRSVDVVAAAERMLRK